MPTKQISSPQEGKVSKEKTQKTQIAHFRQLIGAWSANEQKQHIFREELPHPFRQRQSKLESKRFVYSINYEPPL